MHNLNITQRLVCSQTYSFGAQQHAYQLFLVTSWFDYVCIQVACWVNFTQKYRIQHKLLFSDYNL